MLRTLRVSMSFEETNKVTHVPGPYMSMVFFFPVMAFSLQDINSLPKRMCRILWWSSPETENQQLRP